MPSLLYYMLVDQYSATVELFSRIEDTQEWINSPVRKHGRYYRITRISVEMTLGAIYDSIELIPAEEDIDLDERP